MNTVCDGTGTPFTVGDVVTWPVLDNGQVRMWWGVVQAISPTVTVGHNAYYHHGIQMAQAVYPGREERRVETIPLPDLNIVTALPHFTAARLNMTARGTDLGETP